MFEAFFTDPCMRYRTEVINGIDFYGLGFSMVRGECVAEGTLRWMQEGEAAAVLITNTSLPDMSGFELARHIRRQFPCLRVIFLTDTPNLAEAQQAVRCGAYDYLPKSDGIDALRSAMIRVSEELHTESRPGVAFDRANHRVGYGGGFYERYLEKHPQLERVAIAFSFQMLPEVPTEPTDICPQIIVTEEEICYLTD